MPYIKSISIHTTVNRSLAYILNPDKTEDLMYTAAMNCSSNAKDAYLNMKMVYEQFSDDKYNSPPEPNKKGKIKAIHYIQSFDPADNISPELAHRIGKAFARKTFGDDCQVVIATHVDKSHVHNHIILNSYSLTGKKFYANQSSLKRAKEYSDRVCLAFGVQPYEKNKGKGKTVDYNEWKHKKKGTSWKEKIRLEIDGLIGYVKNLDELLYELESRGYEVKKGKYISIKAPEQKRFIRTKTLGEDYTADSLTSRILWRDVGTGVSLSDYEPSELRESYQTVLGQVTQLAMDNKKVQRKRFSSQPYSPENDMDLYKLSAQLTIINRDRLHSIGELEGKVEMLKSEYEKARLELNQLTTRQETLASLLSQADIYFELSGRSELSETDKLKLNICRQSMMNNNINDHNAYDHLKSVVNETSKKITSLKENFKSCQQLYDVYSDIVKTYYEISKSDYISKLVAEEQKKKEQDAQKKKNLSI